MRELLRKLSGGDQAPDSTLSADIEAYRERQRAAAERLRQGDHVLAELERQCRSFVEEVARAPKTAR